MPSVVLKELTSKLFKEVLLDTLNIDKVYVLGTSAGGAVAIKFALLHPERTKGLILYCSGFPATEKPDNEVTYVGPPAAICYDFPIYYYDYSDDINIF